MRLHLKEKNVCEEILNERKKIAVDLALLKSKRVNISADPLYLLTH